MIEADESLVTILGDASPVVTVLTVGRRTGKSFGGTGGGTSKSDWRLTGLSCGGELVRVPIGIESSPPLGGLLSVLMTEEEARKVRE
jgi:hypothetical protein